MRQARKWCGLAGAFALGLRWHGRGGQTWLGPHDMQHDEEPHERDVDGVLTDRGRALLQALDRSAVGSPRSHCDVTASYDPGREALNPSESRWNGGNPPFGAAAGERAAGASAPSRWRRRNTAAEHHACRSEEVSRPHSTHIWTHPGMQGDFRADMVWLRPYIRLLVEDTRTSEPCWIFARFPSFSIRRPSRRVGGSRVWGSWSNLLCHHLCILDAIHGEPRGLLLLIRFLLPS